MKLLRIVPAPRSQTSGGGSDSGLAWKPSTKEIAMEAKELSKLSIDELKMLIKGQKEKAKSEQVLARITAQLRAAPTEFVKAHNKYYKEELERIALAYVK